MKNPNAADLAILHPEQVAVFEQAMTRIEAGATKLIVAMPSGTGRTMAIASVLLRLERPMLIVAPPALQTQWLSMLRRWCRHTYIRRSSERFVERRELDAIDIVAPQLVREGGAVAGQIASYEWVVCGIGTPGIVANRLRLRAKRLIVESDGLTPPLDNAGDVAAVIHLTRGEMV